MTRHAEMYGFRVTKQGDLSDKSLPAFNRRYIYPMDEVAAGIVKYGDSAGPIFVGAIVNTTPRSFNRSYSFQPLLYLAHRRHIDSELLLAIHTKDGVHLGLIVRAQTTGSGADGSTRQIEILAEMA
jgi:hypothetical protein